LASVEENDEDTIRFAAVGCLPTSAQAVLG
jgi:hypothetical protein